MALNLQQKYSQLDNLYELYIFQGFKNLIFYWNFQENGIVNDRESLNNLMKQDNVQNVYGVSEGLKGFTKMFSSEPTSNFRYFVSTYFKFTVFEICSGIKVILISQVNDSTDYYDALKDVYYKAYLEYVQRDSFYQHSEPLSSPYFIEKMQEIMEPYMKPAEPK